VADALVCVCCGGASFETRFPTLASGFSIGFCTRCGAGRTLPDVSDDAIGGFYPPEYYGETNRRFNVVIEALSVQLRRRRARAIARRVGGHGRVMDVGCGRGITLASLKALGFETFGIELSDSAAEHARSVLHIDVGTDLFAPRYEPGTFDGVFFWHSLEHIRRADLAIERARELLRPGGKLCVAVPNVEGLQSRLFGGSWFHLDAPRHYHHFGVDSLSAMLMRIGFDVEDVDHFNIEQNPFGYIQSTLNHLGLTENTLYTMLKNPSARAASVAAAPIAAAVSALAAPALTMAGLSASLVESLVGRGGTIEVWARKNTHAQPRP
jgi:SAM-dependent methyltransferase